MSTLYWQRAVAKGLVRGEQPFPPRTKPPRHVPRFLVPAGTPCAVRRVTERDWRVYTTKQDAAFERFERYERCEGGYYHFRSDVGGWLLLVSRRHVRHREDAYLPGE